MGKKKKNNIIADILSKSEKNKTYKRTENRMILASKILEAMDRNGITKSDLAELCNKDRSTISRWLSGTHNFTSDTLFEIEEVLDCNIFEDSNSEVVSQSYNVNFQLFASHTTKETYKNTTQTTVNKYPVTTGNC